MVIYSHGSVRIGEDWGQEDLFDELKMVNVFGKDVGEDCLQEAKEMSSDGVL